MKDFSEIAAPMVEGLVDDPDRGPPDVRQPTTLPESADGDFGEIVRIAPDTENPESIGIDDIDPGDIDAGRRVFPEVGIDILAFYKSFRFRQLPPFPGNWGVFLIDVGVATLVEEFRLQRPNLPLTDLQKIATSALLYHEQYHFWIDVWALAQEMSSLHASKIKQYEYYFEQRKQFSLTGLDFEESLANHYMFRRLSKFHMSDGSRPTRLVAKFLDQCPEPYSHYRMRASQRMIKERQLAGAITNGSYVAAIGLAGVDPHSESIGQVIASSITFEDRKYPLKEFNTLCPVFVVRDRHFASRVIPFQPPDRVECKRFVTNYLAGTLDRRTDHEYFQIDNGEILKFPNPHEKEIRRYELGNMLAKAGMRRPEYWKEKQITKTWKKGCPRTTPKPPLV